MQVSLQTERPSSADSVEKLVARRARASGKKFDLLDRPTNRSRASIKGKAPHENFTRSTATEFFNKIGQKRLGDAMV